MRALSLALAALLLVGGPHLTARADDVKDLLAQAVKALENTELYKALELLNKVIKLDPKQAVAHRELGRVYRWQKRDMKAAAALAKAVELDDTDGLAHLFYGLVLSDLGERELALKHIGRAVGMISPELASNGVNLRMLGHLEMGRIYRSTRRIEEAQAAFKRAHEVHPAYPEPIRQLAEMARRAGHFSEARTWYEKLIERAPKDRYKERLAAIMKKQKVARLELELVDDSVPTGGVLTAKEVGFRGYDDKNRIVDFQRFWEVSGGLKLVSTDPLKIVAGDKPSKDEYIYLTDKATGVQGKTRVRVLGPAKQLKMVPELLSRMPGTDAIVHLRGVDAAGNEFPVTKAKWGIKRGDKDEALDVGFLRGDRYRIKLPATTPLGRLTLRAKDGDREVVGQLDIVRYDAPDRGVRWQLDLAKARKAAAESGKPLLIYLWTIDCKDCDRMTYEVFSDAKVREDLKLFVPARVNAANRRDLLRLFSIKAIPAFIVLSPSGAYVGRGHNFMGPTTFHKKVIEFPKQAKSVEARLAALKAEAQKGGVPKLRALGAFYEMRYLNAEAMATYEAAIKTEGDLVERNKARLALARLHRVEGDFPTMEGLADDVLETKPTGEQLAQALYYKAYATFYGRARWEEAAKLWKQVAAMRKEARSWANRSRDKLRRFDLE